MNAPVRLDATKLLGFRLSPAAREDPGSGPVTLGPKVGTKVGGKPIIGAVAGAKVGMKPAPDRIS